MVPPYYDSMIANVIVYGTTRERCLMRLKRALEEFVIEGMKTTIPLHQALLDDPEFQRGDYTIKWLDEWLARQQRSEEHTSELQSLMRNSYAVFCLKNKNPSTQTIMTHTHNSPNT